MSVNAHQTSEISTTDTDISSLKAMATFEKGVETADDSAALKLSLEIGERESILMTDDQHHDHIASHPVTDSNPNSTSEGIVEEKALSGITANDSSDLKGNV